MKILLAGRGRPYVDGDSYDHSAPLAFTVDGVMTDAECAALVAEIDRRGPTAAPVTTSRGMVMMPDVRNNERVILDDDVLAKRLWARVAGAMPERLFARRPVGANERFRCYRYQPGQQFAMHRDGAFRRSEREKSELTFMVYLNEGFGGGGTKFYDEDVTAVPKTGTALFFQHRLLHEGSVVTSGVKYVLRSDVMFSD
jgi:predicted 2-oxoglutarate/Fe(II)-dependent dioxygenase YbiX